MKGSPTESMEATKTASSASEKVVEIKNLQISFGSQQVLKDVSLDLFKEENLVVLGKSGSGKSVLIKCLVGLLVADSGQITALGKNLTNINPKELNELRTKIGFLFQGAALYDSMTVKQNLEFPLKRIHKKLSQEQVDTKINEALENVGLADALNKMPSQLSGGMRKRIGLARTLIVDPEIILYDEPTTGLDPITSAEISLLINDVQKKYHTSSIIITHDIECAKTTSNRVVMLKDGEVYANDSIKELENSTDEWIKSFFKSKLKKINKMNTQSEKFKVRLGLFVAIGLVLFVIAIFLIGRQKNLFNPVFQLSAYYKNVSGLQVGNNIRFSGINVGTVDNIEIANDTTVKVTMLIQKEVQKFIKPDSKVVIGSEGIIGDRLLIITQGTTGKSAVKNNQILTSIEPIETDAIMSSLKVTGENAEIVTDQLVQILSKINSGNGTLGRLIQDSTIAENLDQTIFNLKNGSKGLDENMEAAKHNFLLKGFFNKKEKAAAKKREAAEEKKKDALEEKEKQNNK